MSSTESSSQDAANRWKVVVLAGGDSAEREISLQSGECVARALSAAGHTVIRLDPFEQPLTGFDWQGTDIALIALHGTHGEDGTVQQQLRALNVVFTGSDADASYLAFHKIKAKEKFIEHGLPTPEYRVVPPDMEFGRIAALAAEIGYPLVVKPEAQGSSLGVTILTSSSQLQVAVEHARELDELVLLERAIPGQEWTVPVFDDRALFPIRIGTPHEFFDFHAKYFDDQTQYDVISDPADPVAQKVQELSRRASLALGCTGISRVDVRVDPAGEPRLLEVNTIPGMTSHSLVPKSAAAHGWSMAQLCEEIIRSALQNSPPASPR